MSVVESFVNTTSSTTSTSAPIVSLLQDVLRKVEASVVSTIQEHTVGASVNPTQSDLSSKAKTTTTSTAMYHPQKDGIDFLDTKNTLLLSYMIDLVVHLRNFFRHVQQQQEQGEYDHNDPNENDDDATITARRNDSTQRNEMRLMEMKVLLDKISTGLDRKLRYQIDKVLLYHLESSSSAAASASPHMTNGASMFATRTDPLQYRPGILQQHQPRGGTKTLSDNNDDDQDDDDQDKDSDDYDHDDNDDDDDDVDEDYKAARQTLQMASMTTGKGKKTSSSSSMVVSDVDPSTDTNVYRAPRFMSTPYPSSNERNMDESIPMMMMDDDDHDHNHSAQREERRRQQKLRNSEIVQTLREQLHDHRPDQDDIIGTGTGGGGGGTTRTTDRTMKFMSRDQYQYQQAQKEKIQFEEDYMIRLPRTKTERKQQLMYEQPHRQHEQHTITALTKDLHRIIGGSEKKYHPVTDRRSSSSRNQSQVPTTTVPSSSSNESKRKSGPKNSLQAALFGGSSTGSNKKKKKR